MRILLMGLMWLMVIMLSVCLTHIGVRCMVEGNMIQMILGGFIELLVVVALTLFTVSMMPMKD